MNEQRANSSGEILLNRRPRRAGGAGSDGSAGRCEIALDELAGLRRVTIGNALVRAEILLDKGANVRQFRHVPTGARALAETRDWVEQLAAFKRNGCRGGSYSDCYEGGWQDVLPARARWDGGAIEEGDGVGEAAIVPWEVTRCLCTPTAAHLLCRARLPRCGLEVSKRFELRRGRAALCVETTVRNAGGRDVHLSWTQHPALGGDLLEETSRLWLPGGRLRVRRDASVGGADGAFNGSVRARWASVESLLPPPPPPPPPATGGADRFATFANVEEGAATLVSPSRRLGVQLRWDAVTFPHAWLWSARRDDLCCVAVEPSTTYLPEMLQHPARPILHLLRDGQSARTRLELSLVAAPSGMQRRR